MNASSAVGNRNRSVLSAALLLLLAAVPSYGATRTDRAKAPPGPKATQQKAKGDVSDKGNASSAGGLQPKLTPVPLTDIQSIYESIRNDQKAAESFCVSRDGRHCASFKYLGITSWTVQIDGREGPRFSSPLRNGIFPTDDFGQVFFWVRDETSRSNLVVQQRDGTAKFYPAPGAEAWKIIVDESLTNRHVIRVRPATLSDPRLDRAALELRRERSIEKQIDGQPTVFGPFMSASAGPTFDEGRQHHLFDGWFAGDGAWERAVFVDGVRVCKEFLPTGEVNGSRYDESRLLGSKGDYFVRFVAGGKTTDILNGKKIATYDKTPEGTVFSSDGRHIATFLPTGHGIEISLDGKPIATQPIGARIKKVEITADGSNVVYGLTANAHEYVFVDDREIPLGGASGVQDVWAGPHAGQYACLLTAPNNHRELIINGRHFPYFPDRTGKSQKMDSLDEIWFSADGEHMVGYSRRAQIAFWVDGAVVRPEAGEPAPGRPARHFPTEHVLRPIRVDENHWQVVVINNAGTAANAKVNPFTRIDLEVDWRPAKAE